MSNICVLGDGNFGSAIAQLIANNGYKVNIWCNNSVIADSINQNNINSVYLPEVKLNKNIKAFTDINEAIDESTFIFVAIPVQFLRSSLKNCKYTQDQVWVSLSKGIESETFFLPTQIVDDAFKNDVKKAVLLGPTFAHDLLQEKLTAVNLFANDKNFETIKSILQNDFFKIKKINDLIGMQLCAAYKNIIALALGVATGKNYAENTKAYLMSKLIDELRILLIFFKANEDTIFTLCGIGDIILTCYGKHSKNYNLGLEIGRGLNLRKNTIAEGINSLKTFLELSKIHKFNLTMLNNLNEIVFENRNRDLL